MDNFKKQEALKPYFDSSYGYAYFGSVAKAGFGIGGAGGSGEVYVGDKLVGKTTMMQLSFGFQFGGQVYQEIIFFQTEQDFNNFSSGNFEFGAGANVVALTASASAKATTLGNQSIQGGLAPNLIDVQGSATPEYTKGMAVFTITLGGLMYEASISGQKFSYKAIESSS